MAWNPSRSSKVSKNSNCSLVSNKNVNEILPSNSLGPGPGEVGQCGLKVLYLWRHSHKILTPQPKNFFRVQTTRLAQSFELLTRSVVLTGPEKFPRKATYDPAVFARTAWISLAANVLSFWLIITLGNTLFNKIFFLKSLLKFHRSTSKHQRSKT